MKSLKQLAAITVFGALTLAGLHAQTMELRANIPFDFTVGRASMPAGDYAIRTQGAVVLVQRVDGGKPASAYVITIGTSGTGASGSSRLNFHRFGDQYFLSAIWNSDTGAGREVPRTDREVAMAKRFGASVEATVLASRR